MSRLPRDEEVEIVRTSPHIRQDLDARGSDSLAVDAHCAFGLAVFVQHALEDGGVALCYFPVPAHPPKGVYEEMDVWTDVVLDGGAMN